MTKPATPSASKPASRDRAAGDENDVALTFEDRLRIFWKKNDKMVLILIVVVLVGILAKGGWEYLEAQKEKELQSEFAAATTPEKMRAYAAAHPGHLLGDIARLRVADDAYAAGKSAEAITGYEEAIAAFKSGPLLSRAKLGLAMSRLQAGKTADGEAGLKVLANDNAEPKAVRVEAAYHLASLASAAGRADDVRKYSELILQVDPTPRKSWTQRAYQLQANLPVAPTAPARAADAGPAIKLPGK